MCVMARSLSFLLPNSLSNINLSDASQNLHFTSLSTLYSNVYSESNNKKEKMGCIASMNSVGRRKQKSIIPEVVVYVPSMRAPAQTDLQRSLKGLVPPDLIDRLACLRNQIALVAEDTGGSAVAELTRTLEEYLPLLLGLIKKGNGLEDLVEFKWKNLEDGQQENSLSNCWFEILSVVHMMAMLTLSEANSLMIPKDYSGSGIRVVSSDCKRDAVDLLLKAAGYLEFCVNEILNHIPADIKKRLPKDLQDFVLESYLFKL